MESDGRVGRAAEQCFVAVSTLRYRLGNIEERLGAHPADPELAFRLALAFQIQDLLAAADHGRGRGHAARAVIEGEQSSST